MTTVNIDLRQLSGTTPGVEPKPGAEVWFTPYRVYHVEDGADDYLVTTQILEVPLPEGSATIDLPETPAGHGLWVQLRSIRHAPDRWLVAIPGTSCDLFDLPHLDPASLDPEAPVSPAWLAALEAVQDGLVGKADASALAAEAEARAAADALLQPIATLGPVQQADGTPVPGYRYRVIVNPLTPTEIEDIIVEAV